MDPKYMAGLLSEHPPPPPRGILDMLMQTWPVRASQDALQGLMAPGNAYSGALPMAGPGLRREDFTDAPLNVQSREGGIPGIRDMFNPVAAQPNDPMVGSAANLAGLLMGGSYAAPAVQGGAGMGIRAYHGSPHDFDKFSMQHLGKGEGAQAYGHGLYFADKEATARSYRDNLANFSWDFNGSGKPISSDLSRLLTDTHIQRPGLTASDVMDLAQQELRAHERAALRAGDMNWYNSVTNTLSDLNHLRRDPPKTAGRMYEVDIKANPDQFLDWDRPLQGQSETVKAALAKQGIAEGYQVIGASGKLPKIYATMDEAVAASPTVGGTGIVKTYHPGGSEIYNDGLLRQRKLSSGNSFGASSRDVSAALRDAGIPGIKYLDQGSRAAGDGTRNYVVFDDSLIDIVKKYGVAGLLAGGAGGASYEPR